MSSHEKVIRLEARLGAWKAFGLRVAAKKEPPRGNALADKLLVVARERDELKKVAHKRKATKHEAAANYLPHIKAVARRNEALRAENEALQARLRELEALAGLTSDIAVLATIDSADVLGVCSPGVVLLHRSPKRG
jgi:predicted RNase H-like nuclease (RuvC/YqgF family)